MSVADLIVRLRGRSADWDALDHEAADALERLERLVREKEREPPTRETSG